MCWEMFSGYTAFDMHWGTGKSAGAPAYNAAHHHPSEVKGLVRDDKGIWRQPGPTEPVR